MKQPAERRPLRLRAAAILSLILIIFPAQTSGDELEVRTIPRGDRVEGPEYTPAIRADFFGSGTSPVIPANVSMSGGALLGIHMNWQATLLPQTAFPNRSADEVRPLLITAEFLAGLAGEFILGNAGLLVNNPTGMIGYTLGSTVGIYYAGNAGGETGPLWRTFLGSVVGVTAGWFLGDITRGIVFVFLPPV
ncbi:hypothetical protein ACFLT7_06750, partial [candidate division KSB1 bacterium]